MLWTIRIKVLVPLHYLSNIAITSTSAVCFYCFEIKYIPQEVLKKSKTNQ